MWSKTHVDLHGPECLCVPSAYMRDNKGACMGLMGQARNKRENERVLDCAKIRR